METLVANGLIQGESEGFFPLSVWLSFRAKDGRVFTAPVLLSSAGLMRYPSAWLIRQAENHRSAAVLSKRARALLRWAQYAYAFSPGGLPQNATAGDIQMATQGFFTGFVNRLNQGCPELNWSPMRFGTAENYGCCIAEFADWLLKQSGFESANNPDPKILSKAKHWSTNQDRIERDMLGHLYRATREGQGQGLIRISKQNNPRWSLSKQLSRSRNDGSMRHPETRKGYKPAAMPISDYLRLLESTRADGYWRNLCLWLLLGAGCCRISEALNLYATDVHFLASLGAENKSEMSLDESFVALANPVEGLVQVEEGRWIQRRVFLRERYGLTPRNLLAADDSLFAGYKGMALGGTLDCSIPEIAMWANRGWALVEWLLPSFGRLFTLAFLRYRNELIQEGISALAAPRHPYLFINLSRNKGSPLTRLNVNQQLSVACRRAGIRERSPHSLRHMYGAECAALGVPLGETQLRMRHRSAKSTLAYFKMSRTEVRKLLASRDRSLIERHEFMREREKGLHLRLF